MVTVIREPAAAAKQLEFALKNLDGKVGKVGWFEKSQYPEEKNRKSIAVATVAAIQEYGDSTRGIPPRPFMRPTIAQQQLVWSKIAEDGAKAILKGKSDVGAVMEAIGLKAAGDIRKTISSIWTPPLSPYTIQARLAKRNNKSHVGNLNKPLIDTGIMFNTLTNTVE